MKKNIRPVAVFTALQLLGLASLPAATVTLGTSTPGVGDGVQNLNFSTGDADNTNHPFVGSDAIAAGELNKGQSFTTGSDAGYLLNSISVRQVSWTSDWDFDGGSITIRFFEVVSDNNAVYQTTELATDTVSMAPNNNSATIGGTPAPTWLTFGFTTPVALNPNAKYAFAFSATGNSGNGEFFMTLDGTNSDAFAGGESITVDGSTTLWNGKGSGNVSDRAFVANMTIVPEPSAALLGAFGLLGLLRRRR